MKQSNILKPTLKFSEKTSVYDSLPNSNGNVSVTRIIRKNDVTIDLDN